MSSKDFDTIISVKKNLHFMSGMMLAWDTDSIEIGQDEKDGFWFMLECIRKELEGIELSHPATTATPTTH